MHWDRKPVFIVQPPYGKGWVSVRILVSCPTCNLQNSDWSNSNFFCRMKLVKSQITSTKLQINPNDQNSKSQTLIIKSLNSRHSGEACAGLDPVAGVQELSKFLDSAKASLHAQLSPQWQLPIFWLLADSSLFESLVRRRRMGFICYLWFGAWNL